MSPLPPELQAPAVTTEQRVLRSTLAGYGIQLARLLVGFAAKVVLARLILPEGHGLYELALRIVTIAAACRDLGLPYHLIRDSRRPYGTVFAATMMLGGFVTIVLVLGAPLASVLTPDLPAVLRVLAFWVLLDGLSVVPRAFFERELKIGSLMMPEIWRAAAITAVAITLAWLGWGVWSFVIADLAGAALLAVLMWSRAWGKVPLRVDLSLLPDLVRKSAWLFWIWVLVQLVTYIDVYIIEAFGDTTTVGLYARSYWIAFLVAVLVYPRALYPILLEYVADRARFLEVFRLSAIQLLGCQVVASYFLATNAGKVLWILSGDGWEGAVPLLQVLAFVPFFDQFTVLGGELLKARHEERLWWWVMVANLVSLVGFGIVLTERFGAVGMGAANYLLLGNLLMAWRLWQVFRERFRSLIGDLALLYAVPLPFFAAAAWLFPSGSWERFGASLLAALLAAGVLVAKYRGAFRAFFAAREVPGASLRQPGEAGT